MIHALPGMGADERMFPPPWNSLPGFVTHNWKSWSGENTLSDMAETLCKNGFINDGDSLIGASLGGMVACEITKLRKIEKLFLVGSASHKDEINCILKALHPLAKIAPIDWLCFSSGKIPHDLTQMFAGANADFIRTMCAAIFDWPGLIQTKTQVYRIHGQNDLVIPPPKFADLFLNGGHLISITHAPACVDFIQNHIGN
jgi:pimeloyl-ACP methyl ester carboxylesterase